MRQLDAARELIRRKRVLAVAAPQIEEKARKLCPNLRAILKPAFAKITKVADKCCEQPNSENGSALGFAFLRNSAKSRKIKKLSREFYCRSLAAYFKRARQFEKSI